jgi:hypothetical protein
MKTIKDTELKYLNGDKILEGDNVEYSYMRKGGGVLPDKLKGTIVYKNAAFYIESDILLNGNPAWEKTIASILENNAQIPDKFPMDIINLI